jgi:UDP-glucose 6-dehydrogenase
MIVARRKPRQTLNAADVCNEAQKRLLLKKSLQRFDGRFGGKTVTVGDLSFEPKTDDMREAPSIVLVDGLVGESARVQAHTPVTHETAHRVFGDPIVYARKTPRYPSAATHGDCSPPRTPPSTANAASRGARSRRPDPH